MNKVHKSVWNAAAGTFVAAAETTKARGKKSKSVVGGALAVAATSLTMSGGAYAQAMPVNPGPATPLIGQAGVEFCSANLAYGINTSNCTIPSSVKGMMGSGDGSGGTDGFGLFVSYGDSFHTATQPAFVVGTQSGDLVLHGNNGISMLDNVLMYGNQIKNLAPGEVSGTSMDGINGAQLYQRTRYFNANSASSAPSTDARAMGTNSVASGPNSLAAGSNSSAYGAGAVALVSNSVALGAGSVASRNDSVSVGYLSADGKSQYTRQITNVTAGAAGTDAVNVNQLNAAIASITGGGPGPDTPNAVVYDDSGLGLITLGGGSGTKITNLKAGDISSAYSMDAVNGSQLYETNQNVANVANDVANVAGNVTNITNVVNNIVQNGIAGSPNVVVYDSSAHDRLTLGGSDATAPVKLANVAAGDISSAKSTDAVNGGQLYQTNMNVQNAQASLVNLAGYTTIIAGNLANVSNTVNYIVNGGGIKYFHTNSTLADSSATGTDSTAIGGAASATANNAIALGSNSVADRANSVSVGKSGSERQLTNLAAGTQTTDAVNVGQLNAAIANVTGGSGGSPDAVIYDSSLHNKLSLGGVGASAPVALTNVAAGTVTATSKDAINGSQLYNTASSVAAALGGGSSVTSAGTIADPTYALSSGTYTDVGSALAGMDGQISSMNTTVTNTTKYINVVSTANAASATGTESVAIGGGAKASGANSLSFGSGSNASADNSIAIGANSVANANNTVSVGKKGSERKIVNVANGTVASDVATYGQLTALQASVTQQLAQQSGGVKSMLLAANPLGAAVPVTNYISVSASVTPGGATTTDGSQDAMAIGPTAFAGGTSSLAVGKGASTFQQMSTAVGSGANAAADYTTSIGAAATTGSMATNAVAIGYNANAGNANSLALGSNSVTNANGSIVMGSDSMTTAAATNGLALGTSSTVSAANSVAVGANAIADRANTLSVGNSTAQRQVVNMKAGTALTDAVNVSQLSGVVAALGGGAAINGTDGSITKPSYAVGGKTYSDVGAALAAISTGSGSAGDSVQYDTSAHSKVTLGGTGSTTPVTIANVADGKANNDAVNVAQLKAMGAAIDTSGNITGAFVAYDNTAKSKITLGGVGSTTPVTIANVADGKANNDAVNVAQLKAMGAAIDTSGNITGAFVAYDDTSKNTITLRGASGSTKITGLTAGTLSATSTDAVNGSQLFATNGNVTNLTNVVNNITTGGGVKYFHANGSSGVDSVASGDGSIAVGANAVAVTGSPSAGAGNIAIGQNATANNGGGGNSATALGAGATAGTSGFSGATAIGGSSKATQNSTALGYGASSSGLSTALGNSATATAAEAVALGDKSVADRYNSVSVGNSTQKRQIVNVAAGTEDTDAVNLAQLKAMGAAIDTSGNITGAFVAYDNTAKSKITLGGVGSTTPVTIANVADGKANNDAVNVAQLKAMGAAIDTSGNITGAFVAYDDTSKNTITLRGASGSTKITGLTAGTLSATSTDAVNGSQLFATNGNVTNLTNVVNNITTGGAGVKYFHVNSTGADSVAATPDTVAIGPGSTASGGGSVAMGRNALAAMSGQYASAVAIGDGASASGRATAIGLSATAVDNSVAIGTGSVATQGNTVAVGSTTVQRRIVNLAAGTQDTDAVNLAQLKAMGAAIDTSGNITGAFVAYDNTAKSKITLGGVGSTTPVTIANVADGKANNDAVNVAQLKAMGAAIDTSGNITGAFVAYDDTSKNTITLRGASGSTKITGLTAGTLSATSTDAVNGNQLFQTNQNVAGVSGNLTNLTNIVNNITTGGGGVKYFHVNSSLADSSATGANAVAIGGAASATAANSVALGANSVASRANTVDVGSRQITDVIAGTQSNDAVNLGQLEAMGANVDSSGNITNSFVAYDDSTKNTITLHGANGSTKITGLTAGTLAPSSSDAVNGSQLYNTASSVANALGGGASVNPATGAVKAPSYDLSMGSYSDVGSALAGMDGVIGSMNTTVTNTTKYISVVSTSNAASATGTEAVAIGGAAKASGVNSLAFGAGSLASADNSIALGYNSVANATGVISVGKKGAERKIVNVANGVAATDVATFGQLSALQATVTQLAQQSGGVKSMLLASNSLLGDALPVTNFISVSSDVTQGSRGTTTDGSKDAMAIGPTAMAGGASSLAIGKGATTFLESSTAIGANANAASAYSTAIGAAANVGSFSDYSVAIGYNSIVGGMNALAMGSGAQSDGAGSASIGSDAYVMEDATNSVAMGSAATASAANSVALGANAMADRANTVSVGAKGTERQIVNVAAGTQDTDAVNVKQLNTAIANVTGGSGGSPDAVVYDSSSHNKLTLGGVSASAPVALTNVAAGTVSATSKDAVNGAQLYNTAGSVAAALGGNSSVDSDGKVVKPAYALDGQTYSDVGTALAAVNAKAGTGSTLGVAYDDSSKSKITLGGSGSTTPVTISNVADGKADHDAVNVQQLTAAGLNIDTSGNVTNAFVAYDDTSKSKITLGGLSATTPVTISNVADGKADHDAVNVKQLTAAGLNIDTSGNVTNAFVAYDSTSKGQVTFGGIGSTTPVVLANVANGQVTSTSKQAVNGSQLYGTASSVAAALGGGSTVGSDGKVSAALSLNGTTYNTVGEALDGLNAKISTGSTDGVVYDSTVHDKLTLGGANSTTPVQLSNVADAKADNDAVNLKQLKDAGLSIDTSGNVMNAFVAYDNATKGTVTFNAGGSPTQLKNIAAASDLTDAVNFGQMQTYVADHGGSGGTANAVAYDDSSKNTVTLGGAGHDPVTLTNVAAGANATDAVNFAQFSSLQSQVNNLAGGGGDTTYININAPTDGTATPAAASGTDAIAIGNGAIASGEASIAIGKDTHSSGDHATATGAGASSAGDFATAMGTNAAASGTNSVAMGANSSAANSNSVALGAGSTTDRDNSVSVGTADMQRQITNVAAGTQATDAVNLGQVSGMINGVQQSINNVDRSAAKGIASASALNIVTPYLPGRTTLNAGVANYRGFQAVGLGVSRWNEKGTINYNLGVSTSGGNSTIVRAGIGIVLGN